MKILLGIGGSDDSFTALETTVERARTAGDDLTVAVVDNPSADRTYDDVEARVRSVLAEADLDADVRRVEGDAGSRLVDIAESEGFDRIALGGGRRSPMGKISLGQIAQFVLLNSQVSVTLVR
ncbi:universal stress protein [Candidatus Halobonum tyrrellensis]|uniref:Stress response protein-like protein n=1 Tax=Candidatus Halobonum tyrrellensis G22 TaxID=1324957 RepID=V4HBU3_9EURY|nr:universal stress protein [Candidatus Halobonum tyrrellensis]ESP87518.1 stress response protein-like protein [Candidatus Halobonum tyrrellensis G22]